MKKILLYCILFFSIGIVRAQDPGIYDTWYLVSYKDASGETLVITEIEPAISPSITINNDLSFEGNAACNGYEGNFSYYAPNDELILDSFVQTLLTCDFPSHVQFETEFFGYFQPAVNYSYVVLGNFLYLEPEPGLTLTFNREPLSVGDFDSNIATIYPNPVSEELFISSEQNTLDGVAVFSISGQQLIQRTGQINSLDVSSLSEGVYFLEIISEGRKQVQKFVKR